MIDVEPWIRDELERLAPFEAVERDWADALERSEQLAPRRDRKGLYRRRRLAIVVPIAALVLVGLVLLPTQLADRGHIGIVDRALAAVSGGPVLHAVLRIDTAEGWISPSGHPRFTTLNLSTGHERVVETTTEIWFDEERHTLHTTTTVNGAVQFDQLVTPSFSRSNLNRRDKPGMSATADVGLVASMTGYKEALASGRARIAGRGRFRGHEVIWIRFEQKSGVAEEVAVDERTYRALYLRAVCPRCTSRPATYAIVSLGGVSRAGADFARPVAPPASNGRYGNTETRAIPLRAASKLLRVQALWSGPEVAGIKLSLVQFVNNSRHSSLPITKRNVVGRGFGIRAIYGADVQANGGYRVPPGRPYVGVDETTSFRYGTGNFANRGGRFAETVAGAPVPMWPEIALSMTDRALWTAQTHRGQLWIEIDASSRALVVAAAKSLVSIRR
jgi:hypothetical protein